MWSTLSASLQVKDTSLAGRSLEAYAASTEARSIGALKVSDSSALGKTPRLPSAGTLLTMETEPGAGGAGAGGSAGPAGPGPGLGAGLLTTPASTLDSRTEP